MTELINAILIIILMLNLFSLGTSRIIALIRVVAAQGILLGMIPLLMHSHLTLTVVITTVLAIALKGVVIPAVMMRALRDARIVREIEPLIGLFPSILLGAAATGFALMLAGYLPLTKIHEQGLFVPASIATVLVGFILLISRYKAITQVIGYLVLENGIFIFSLLLLDAMPLVVEMGVLLDLFVGIFVICIIVNRVNRAFSSMDTRRMTLLKE